MDPVDQKFSPGVGRWFFTPPGMNDVTQWDSDGGWVTIEDPNNFTHKFGGKDG
jgi:hypothetical protein